jgi:hypothetical protein
MKMAEIDVHKKVLMVVVVDTSVPEKKPVRRRFVTLPPDFVLWAPATERLIAFEQRPVVLKYVILSHQLALPRLETSALNFDQADAFAIPTRSYPRGR